MDPPPPLELKDLHNDLCRRPSAVIPDEDGLCRAAVAAIFRQQEGGPVELLFIHRSVHDADPWSGQVGFPGGRQDEQDANLQATAVRETLEELGLELGRGGCAKLLGHLDDLQARARMKILPMAIRPFAYVLSAPGAPLLEPNEEVQEAFWFPVDSLSDANRRTWVEATRVDLPLQFPGVTLGKGRVLWGLTYVMVLEILGRLGLVDDPVGLSLPRSTVR